MNLNQSCVQKVSGIGLGILMSAMLVACDNDNNTDTQIDGDLLQAFVAGRSPDYTSSRIERISLTDGDVSTGFYPAVDGSDIQARTDGSNLYEIGRFGLDRLTRFNVDDTATVDFQFSVNGDGESNSNPYDVVFVNSTKAYVIRYGSPKVLIIDPSVSADMEDAFVTGELDLSAYDSDESPQASGGVVVDGKLFVLMERLDGFSPTKNGYLAVFDTETDEEIDTLQGTAEGLKGIPLSINNPTGLQYNDAANMLYVVGRGNFYAMASPDTERFTGGIQSIDPTSFTASLITDDGSEDENNGFFSSILVTSAEKGYLLTYASFGDTTLRTFNPTTGAVDADPVSGLSNLDVTTLNLDPDNRLWIGLNSATPGFKLLDAADDSVLKELVATELVPINVVFVDRR